MITIMYFGILRELVGKDTEEENILEDNITLKYLMDELSKKYPSIKKINYSIAVNESYAKDTVLIQNGDIIALIPPVSGG